jgi:fructokinase
MPTCSYPAIIAAVEGGGTSFRVAVCRVDNSHSLPTILTRTEIDSSNDPCQTLDACVSFLRAHRPAPGGYQALGIASFGPVGVNANRPEEYGRILSTSPKVNWRNVDLLTPLRDACRGENGDEQQELVCRVETDVNAPALVEYLQIRDSGMESVAYVTVGTGVGVGLVVNGRPVHGRMHPEGGHVCVQPLEGDNFGGYSWGKDHNPYQGRNTVEALASSVALTERLEIMELSKNALPRSVLAQLPDDHEVWDHAANALANLCVTLLLTLSMEKIVLGGGVMRRKGLLEKVQARTVTIMNGYLALPTNDMSLLITTSEYGDSIGLIGAIVLAQRALTDESADRDKQLKRNAFGQGMWHGMVVGALGAGLVCKYLWPGNRRR